jgi:hypothetical protein
MYIFLGFGFWAPKASAEYNSGSMGIDHADSKVLHPFKLAGTAKGSWARYCIRSSSRRCELAAVTFIVDSSHER